MKFRILIICCFFLSSCSVFYPGGITFNGANYNYDYYAFNEKLDYSEVSYLLNPTNFSGSKFSNGSNLENVVEFFQKKLGKKVTLKKNFKDKNGKLKIPFLINFDITDEEVRFLKSNTKLDYIILSKISYLNELDHTSLNQQNVKRFQTATAVAISFIKILDLRTTIPLIEMSCSGNIKINEARNIQTRISEFQPKAIHKDSYGLGEKTMEKLLRKIK